MKENAKKLLLFLYSKETQTPFFATADTLAVITPANTAAGQRSLLSLMKTRRLITTEKIGGEVRYRITIDGIKALKTALPVLDRERGWNGEWTGLIFKQAPAGDQQFRYLRTILHRFQSLPLTRGVYVYPGPFPYAVEQEIENRYGHSVILFEIKKWLSDDERQIAIEHYGLSDLLQTYSGISSEVDRLINAKKSNMDMNQQQKMHISSLFNRLYENMIGDMGLLHFYFPQVQSGAELLARFQSYFV